jgi:hypothetical protein
MTIAYSWYKKVYYVYADGQEGHHRETYRIISVLN